MQIFPNGLMFYGGREVADLDEDGLPVSVGETYENQCICTITTAAENRNAVYDGGVFKQATYTVTCNMEDVGENFNPRRVRLTHNQKGDLGTRQVLRIEYYMITQTVELWV